MNQQLIQKLNNWIKRHDRDDVARIYLHMSGYTEYLMPTYVATVVRNRASRQLSQAIEHLSNEINLEFKDAKVTIVELAYCTEEEMKKSFAIPRHAIKITPPSSGRLPAPPCT
jgi:hypothetical protein